MFLAPIYDLIFDKPCLRLSEESLVVLRPIGDWSMEQDGNYLHIYGCSSAPHILPMHVLDRLVLMEIVCQMAKFGSNSKLKEHKKGMFPAYPLMTIAFTLVYFATALVQADEWISTN